MISTIGTHSSGQPSRKINAMIRNRISIGDRSSIRRYSVSMVGVPSRENTAPKKFDAATRNRISVEISSVLTSASCMPFQVSFR